MAAVGITGGDPDKVDVAGDTMTGPLVLPGNPTLPLHAATREWVLAQTGGGGAAVVSVNEVEPDEDGNVELAPADIGAAPAAHGHVIADVTGLQAALDGKAPSAHAHAGEDITSGTVGFARLPTGTGANEVAVGDHSHGGGGSGAVHDISGPLTSGAVTAQLGSWTQFGVDLTVPAATGDTLRLSVSAQRVSGGGTLYGNAATRVAGANQNWWGPESIASGGLPGWYQENPGHFVPAFQPEIYTVQANDVSGGNVTVRFYVQAESSTVDVRAITAFRAAMILENLGAPV